MKLFGNFGSVIICTLLVFRCPAGTGLLYCEKGKYWDEVFSKCHPCTGESSLCNPAGSTRLECLKKCGPEYLPTRSNLPTTSNSPKVLQSTQSTPMPNSSSRLIRWLPWFLIPVILLIVITGILVRHFCRDRIAKIFTRNCPTCSTRRENEGNRFEMVSLTDLPIPEDPNNIVGQGRSQPDEDPEVIIIDETRPAPAQNPGRSKMVTSRSISRQDSVDNPRL